MTKNLVKTGAQTDKEKNEANFSLMVFAKPGELDHIISYLYGVRGLKINKGRAQRHRLQ